MRRFDGQVDRQAWGRLFERAARASGGHEQCVSQFSLEAALLEADLYPADALNAAPKPANPPLAAIEASTASESA